MSTAFVIAMLAVAISLGVVFMGVRAAGAKKQTNKDGGDDTGTMTHGGSSSADCGPGDSGGCGGGGGD